MVDSGSGFRSVEVFGVNVTPCTYETVVDAVISAGLQRVPFGVAALATHGLMTAVHDPNFHGALARLDVVTPDGQPVRWALNLIDEESLAERVYGPDLTDKVCAAAARAGVGVFLFGSTEATSTALQRALELKYPNISIVDSQADRFRDATVEEDALDVARIVGSGAGIVLVGRGCPRQELWVADHLDRIPCAMLAVGAAFDYLGGTLNRPPRWMQRVGLEWLHRLAQEPRRLWKRYTVTNSQFLVRFIALWVRNRVTKARVRLQR